MIFAILSDIHSNLEALEATLSDVPAGATLLHLGDVVGYGAQPNDVIERLGDTRGVMGNHDAAALGILDPEYFNDNARLAIEWTRGTLMRTQVTYLASQPFCRDIVDDPAFPFTLAHGSPKDPELFSYITRSDHALEAFDHFGTQVVFVGHSHHPESYEFRSARRSIARETHGLNNGRDVLSLKEGSRYVINVGSVGQPRDGIALACYLLFDTTLRTVTWRRVAYDIATTQQKIWAAGLPERNADRLASGY